MKGLKVKNIKTIILIITVILCITTYNIYNNNRIKIIEQNIKINNLPQSFNNFTILQITDLHGKHFGENQKKLIEKINSIDYDIIAITGDIKNKHEDNIDAFLDMINGIKNKENIFFVMGNGDDEKFKEEIKNSGCNMLEKPYEFKRGNDSLWINEFVLKQPFDKNGVKIGLSHIPIESNLGYDLVLSGHYHGGQYRIPFYGALFVPNINGNCFLPKQSEVSGLVKRDGYIEYISKGLGSSCDIKALEFRLFNTPELNVIKLVN